VMKAVRIHKPGGPEAMIVEEKVAIPSIKDDEVLINIGVAGLNFIDTYHRTGLYTLPLPAILGREGAGVIEKVGKDVKDWKAGDRVAFMAQGVYAEKVAMPASGLVSVPEGMSLKRCCCCFIARPNRSLSGSLNLPY